MKKIVSYILTIVCLLATFEIPDIHALYTYYVKQVNADGTYTTVLETTNLTEAKTYYAGVDTSNNYALFQDDEVVSVIYGVVVLASGNGCGYNVEYINAINNNSGYSNGCYGADGLFLEANSDYTYYKFEQSNAIAWGKRSDLTILPIEQVSNVTNYHVSDGRLYHQIKTNMYTPNYGTFIELGEAPTYLEEDHYYYSYDGKYFYERFEDMRNDTLVYSHSLAVNKEPYYNYYQYVSNRTTTNYSRDDIEKYLENTLVLNSRMETYLDKNDDYISEILTESQFYGNADAFIQYQYEYGANALMMLAISMNETASGRSALSYTRNNMFGHNAYDNAVEANASRYSSVASSIAYHAKNYVSNSYSNPNKFMYHGSYFGDKGSGMNVSYASDPYWGEKAAMYYMRMDEALGGKDKDSYCLGIKSSATSIPIYAAPSFSAPVLYYSGSNWDYSFVILDKQYVDGYYFYKVQIDPALDENYSTKDVYYYDYETAVGYVSAGNINYVLNDKAMHTNTYVTETYHSDEGVFRNGEHDLTITYKQGDTFTLEHPTVTEYVFNGWDVAEDGTYIATYNHVSNAYLSGDYKTKYRLNQSLSLKDMVMNIIFDDGKSISVPVTSDMVSQIRLLELGDTTIYIYYEGAVAELNVSVTEGDTSIQDEAYNKMFSYLSSKYIFEKDDIPDMMERIKGINEAGTELDEEEIRRIDTIMADYYKDAVQVMIEDENLDTQISGLCFLINDLNLQPTWFPKNLYVNIEKNASLDETFRKIIEGNSYHYYTSFDISLTYDEEPLSAVGNYIISVKTMDNDTTKYYIILAEKDGKIYRLYGDQSTSRIVIDTQGFTHFAIAYLDTTNDYAKPDIEEVYTIAGNGYDKTAMIKKYLIYAIIGIAVLLVLLIIILLLSSPKRLKEKRRLERIKREQEEELERVYVPEPIRTLKKPNEDTKQVKVIQSSAVIDNKSYEETAKQLQSQVREIMLDEELKRANEEYKRQYGDVHEAEDTESKDE